MAAIVAAVNLAVRQAAAGRPDVLVLDLGALISPGGRYTETIRRGGRDVQVRAQDGPAFVKRRLVVARRRHRPGAGGHGVAGRAGAGQGGPYDPRTMTVAFMPGACRAQTIV